LARRKVTTPDHRVPGDIKKKFKMPCGTIIEYDEKGNVVWSWKSSKYLLASDIVHYQSPDGSGIFETHENAFSFDEKEKVIYVSFKNISRVLKLKYPEGTILNAYGEIFKPEVPATGNKMFCYQHSCRHAEDNSFYLFNNNGCNPECAPEVILLQDVPDHKDSLQIAWLYECPVDINKNKPRKDGRRRDNMSSGGNVEELPDHCVFISMGSPYGNLFIVNREKQILWSGVAEKMNAADSKWEDNVQYRGSIITGQEQMEKLVWSALK
jgi:hypothetical protein